MHHLKPDTSTASLVRKFEAALEWRSLAVKTDGAFLALALELSDELKMESLVIKTQTSAV